MKTKYRCKIGGRLFEAKTEVREATLQEAQGIFPNLTVNPVSNLVAVWFPDFENPTLVSKKELSVD